jgi:hypothetical protein
MKASILVVSLVRLTLTGISVFSSSALERSIDFGAAHADVASGYFPSPATLQHQPDGCANPAVVPHGCARRFVCKCFVRAAIRAGGPHFDPGS